MWRSRFFRHNLIDYGGQVLSRVGLLTGEHFERDHRQRELVRAPVHQLALHLLGRHVVGRADDVAGHGELVRRRDLGNAEIRDLGRAVPGDHDVGRFDVAMDDAFLVRIVERHGGLSQDAEHPLGRNGLRFRQHLVERRPIDVFHGDIGQLALLLHVVDGDDSGVRQDARRPRFPKQALAQPVLFLGIAPSAEMDGLDGHRPADIGVDGVVHHPHGAPPQFPDDLISPDALHPVLVIAHEGKTR